MFENQDVKQITEPYFVVIETYKTEKNEIKMHCKR